VSGGFPQFRRNDGPVPPMKKTEKNEERYGHPDKGQPELHLYEDDHTGEWSVWLNTGIADHDGLCIGHGKTRDEAIADAVGVVEWAETELQGPPPELRTWRPHRVLPPCRPTKRYLRFMDGFWQEADEVDGPWARVNDQRDNPGHTHTS
jgi:hypothetical protein